MWVRGCVPIHCQGGDEGAPTGDLVGSEKVTGKHFVRDGDKIGSHPVGDDHVCLIRKGLDVVHHA